MRLIVLKVGVVMLLFFPILVSGLSSDLTTSNSELHSNQTRLDSIIAVIHKEEIFAGLKINGVVETINTPLEKSGDTVSVRDFGAVGDGITDDTSAFNSAIAAVVKRNGGTIYLPNPNAAYKITSTLVVAATSRSITFQGDGIFNSQIYLKSAAASVLFKTYGLVKFRDLTLIGTPVSGNIFRPGDVAIELHGDIKMSGCSIMGFQYGMNWKELGYYIKISDSDLRLMDTVMINFDANNLTIERVKSIQINRFLVTATGVGPIVIRDSSFEYWTNVLFSNSAGATPLYVITGNYFENRPQLTIEAGLAHNPFDRAVNTYIGEVIANAGDTVLDSNMISCHGIFRIVDTGGTARSIKSTKNLIVYQPTSSDTERFFNIGTVKTLQLNDFAYPIGKGSTGSHSTIAYGTFTTTHPESSKVINPITLIDETPETAWSAMTLASGWVNADTTSYQSASYKKIGKRVYLRGVINGTKATSGNFATLSSGYKPVTKLYRAMSTSTVSSTPILVNLRIDSTGALRVTNMPYNTLKYLVLDGLSFDID